MRWKSRTGEPFGVSAVDRRALGSHEAGGSYAQPNAVEERRRSRDSPPTKKGGGATNPDQLPKLNVTHRMELLTMPDQKNMDPHHLGLKKPKSRRTVPETADELQRRRLGEGALGAISVAVMSTPTARELKHQHKRAARAR